MERYILLLYLDKYGLSLYRVMPLVCYWITSKILYNFKHRRWYRSRKFDEMVTGRSAWKRSNVWNFKIHVILLISSVHSGLSTPGLQISCDAYIMFCSVLLEGLVLFYFVEKKVAKEAHVSLIWNKNITSDDFYQFFCFFKYHKIF